MLPGTNVDGSFTNRGGCGSSQSRTKCAPDGLKSTKKGRVTAGTRRVGIHGRPSCCNCLIKSWKNARRPSTLDTVLVWSFLLLYPLKPKGLQLLFLSLISCSTHIRPMFLAAWSCTLVSLCYSSIDFVLLLHVPLFHPLISIHFVLSLFASDDSLGPDSLPLDRKHLLN